MKREADEPRRSALVLDARQGGGELGGKRVGGEWAMDAGRVE